MTTDPDDERLLHRIELYAAAHPGSPSAVRRPRVYRKSRTWIALLGNDLEDGIIGYGDTIEAALRAFDARYLATLRPAIGSDGQAA